MTAKQNGKNILVDLMLAHRIAQSIYVITKLSIPDTIANSLISIDDLAKKTKTSSDALYRVMRMLASYNIFKEKKPRHFENTKLSFYLTKDHPDSFRDAVIYRIELGSASWNELLYSLKTGKTAFEKIFGAPFFQYLVEHPAKSEIYNKGMAAQSQQVFHSVLENYDFSFCDTLVDVGGGQGSFTTAFLKKYSNAKAILFDLPSVIDKFDSPFHDKTILLRLTLQPGDFFESVPSGGDVYFLKTVIHNWEDEDANKILKNIAKKMQSHSHLLLVEAIVPNKSCNDHTFLMDLQMLVQVGGRERTKKEYQALFKQAGCVLNKVYKLPGMFNLIEARLA